MPPQKRFQKNWCMVWHSGGGKFHCVNLRYIKEASERICTCLKKVRTKTVNTKTSKTSPNHKQKKWTRLFHSWKVRDLLCMAMVIHSWFSNDSYAGLCSIPASATTWHLQDTFATRIFWKRNLRVDHHFKLPHIYGRGDLQKDVGFPDFLGICAWMRCMFGCPKMVGVQNRHVRQMLKTSWNLCEGVLISDNGWLWSIYLGGLLVFWHFFLQVILIYHRKIHRIGFITNMCDHKQPLLLRNIARPEIAPFPRHLHLPTWMMTMIPMFRLKIKLKMPCICIHMFLHVSVWISKLQKFSKLFRSKLAMASMWEYILRSSKIWCNLWGFLGGIPGGIPVFPPNFHWPNGLFLITNCKDLRCNFCIPSWRRWKEALSWSDMVIGCCLSGAVRGGNGQKKLGIMSGKLKIAMENPAFWWYFPGKTVIFHSLC